MKIKQIAKILGRQDGVIWKDQLFRFDSRGKCFVYDLLDIESDTVKGLEPFGSFILDKADFIVPHSNAVCWGTEFFDPSDEYPLLYANIYNNYAKSEDRMLGSCLVYRLQRIGNEFQTTLVQLIEVGFCENYPLWKAYPDRHGVRPYGNFVIDTEHRSYWAFVMRNEELGTRFFKFDLPSVHDGEIDARLNIKRVVLGEADIREYFDCEYYRFIQGATLHEGKIYSTEGFFNDTVNCPAIRIIDLMTKQEEYFDLFELGFVNEPEFIDFYNGKCFYSDINGNLYKVDF